jgi:Asp/Glu/hydantoin racemase
MSKYKIWFQGATDRVHMAPYINKLEPHLKAILDPEFTGTFNTTTPSVTTTHALTEFRAARNFIRNTIEAERQGYDAVAITHFQDAGLMEAKSAVEIPVLGLGETTMFHACTLGRKMGLVTINPAFIPWHEDQIIRYGLQQRVVGVRAVDAGISDFMEAFSTKEGYDALYPKWERECQTLLAAGADVIIPAGGLPMMLYASQPGANFEGAPIVNGITVIAKMAEMAIKLKKLAGTGVSRRSNFAKPGEKALREFLEHG